MNRTAIVLAAVVIFATTGCSNKKLIAEKDAQIADLQGDVAALQAEVAEQKQMNAELDRELADLQTEKRVWLEEKDNLVHITLDGAATFPTASADLTAEGKDVLDRIWGVAEQYPNRRILIEGHADARPIAESYRWKYPSNWELSSARAHAVLHYLADAHNAEPSRMAAVGYGENSPVADNATPEGLAQNRRVVITIGSAKAVQELISRRQTGSPSAEFAGGR
ncbi:MAG: OmpA family protein [Candidatus Latescibacteria bacterium]|nr:OmpA family protein [Candidatus Latescibacterota bacterium]